MLRRCLVLIALGGAFAGAADLAGDYVKRCPMPLQECLEKMSSALKTSGWVGIEFDDTLLPEGGYKVVKVVPGSPAANAGLQPGDVLSALNGVQFAENNSAALAKARKEWKPGQSVTYTIKRQGVDRQITLTLAPMPADVMARWIGEHMKAHMATDRTPPK